MLDAGTSLQLAPRRGSLFEVVSMALAWGAALLVVVVAGWLLADVVQQGLAGLSWEFLSQGTRDAGRAGGILPIVTSTLLILLVCLLVCVPLGLATAVLLAEFPEGRGRFGRWTRRSLDVLAAVPSIVFGLFGSAFFCVVLGMGFSILAGGLTLACMVLPIFIRAAEQALAAVPRDQRLGAAALGLSRVATLRRVLLPAALPGLAVALTLGIGRALAETAALLFTSGYVDRQPSSLFDSGRAMSVHIYDLAMNVPGGTKNAYATGLVLVAVLLVLNAASAWLGSRSAVTHGTVKPTGSAT